ncbi:MAG TPA: hypothetical protein IGS40_14415 [Trichormus sp. M33_DOE_039]|nr:hypothetical protein [Trichormus sp. M33_DOE_039]
MTAVATSRALPTTLATSRALPAQRTASPYSIPNALLLLCGKHAPHYEHCQTYIGRHS